MTSTERFWEKVKKSDGCWIWTGSRFKNGYGQFRIKGNPGALAHRFSWKIENGDAGAWWVLHKCDNRACVNPSHLFLGTRQDNIDDMVKKGRHGRGERQGHSKLSDGQILEIREMFSNGFTQVEIAEKFNVSQACVSKIICARRWNHLNLEQIKHGSRAAKGVRCHSAKLTPAEIVEIRKRRVSGESYSKLGRVFGVTNVAIRCICLRQTWKHVL